ncbi:MAG: TonB-dependent receptor [Thermoanaerobaculia bacterium]|nr:TonB-dependent receptor [Thermoanaerobaculia bacterium]
MAATAGTRASLSTATRGQAFGRSLPDRVDQPFEFGGWPGGTFEDDWIAPDAIGFIDGESYGVLDARVSYVWAISDRIEADFFLDIFNVFDDQSVIRVQDLVEGGEGFEYLEGIDYVAPRRYFLGARLRF